MEDLQSFVSNLSFLYANQEAELERKLSALRSEADGIAVELSLLERVNEFFQNYITVKSEKTRRFIEDVVNRGLVYIFQNRIRVSITSEVKNNRVMYDVQIHDDESDVVGGWESHGGGISAVVALLFKFLSNYLTHKCPLLVEDESLSDVSFHYQERLSQFLADLAKEFHYDVLLTSHQQELDKYGRSIYTIAKANGKTYIENIEKGLTDEL